MPKSPDYVKWSTKKDHYLRPGKCCGTCFYSTMDNQQVRNIWCANHFGPLGAIGETYVCNLHKKKKK